MRICTRCGQQNEPGATFCSNRECGAVLEWHSERVDAPAQDRTSGQPGPETQPHIPAGLHQQVAIRTALTQATLDVEPGETVACRLHVRNEGSMVDRLKLEVTGPAAEWAGCDPSSIDLNPGSDGSVTLRFAPPRGPQPTAGTVPFQVRVTSTQDPSVAAVEGGMVTVASFEDLSGELTPATHKGRRSARYQLTAHNRGNSAESLTLSTAGAGERLSCAVEPASVVCEPGATETATVDVRAGKRLWTGPTRRQPFTVTATRDGESTPAFQQQGGFEQRPVLTPSVLFAALVPVLAAVGLVAWLVIREGTVETPDVLGMTPEAAERILTADGLLLGEQDGEGSDQPVGTVIAQSPAGGTEVEPDTPVDITVAEPLPAPVPDLTGQTRDAAELALLREGFLLGVETEEESDEPAGTVIAQSPAAGAELEADQVVDITVAVAPALPPDEECTEEIMANERWACLTGASFDGEVLRIDYEVEWAGSEPDRSNGFHLHLYGGDGTSPAEEIMGTHAPTPRGPWVIEDRPSPLTYPVGDSRDDLIALIRDEPKVCVRIADGDHALVPDETGAGTFTTGNCVPIER